MTRRVIHFLVLVTACALMFLAQPATAQTVPEAVFDPGTNLVNVSISNAMTDTVYTVHFTMTGCVEAAPDSVQLIGPADAGSMELTCVTPDSNGEVVIQFCRGAVCFSTVNMDIGCRSDCSMIEIGKVPALNMWGMMVLILMLVSTAVWVIRKKRAAAH